MSSKQAKADVVPVRQQNQYNCMTTSLCMALRALGVPDEECSPRRVNKVVGAMPMQGAAWEPLLAAANHYGMRATLTLPSTVRQLKGWTDAGNPVVIAWNPEGRDWSHASLVFDVTEDDEHGFLVHIADPNIPDPDETVRVVPKKEFYSKWYEKAPQGFLVRRPACAIEREITPEGRQMMASTRRVAAIWQKSKSSSLNREAKVRTLSSLTVGAKGLYVEFEIISGDISFSDLESVRQHGDSLVETLVADVDRKRVAGGAISVAEPMLEARPFKIVWEISANWVVDEDTLLYKLDQAGASLPFDSFYWKY